MIGAALGALEGHVVPAVLPGFWALAGLAAVLGGVMRERLPQLNGASRRLDRPGLCDGVVYADDTLRHVANHFAVAGIGAARVVERTDPRRAIGEITLSGLLEARLRDHHEEHHRERMFNLRPRAKAELSTIAVNSSGRPNDDR